MAKSNGLGADILASYLVGESEGSNPGEFGIDIFSNAFEDEFPGDNEDPGGGTYQGYSPESNRATENRPWGGKFGDRPKIHELNQPGAAQILGWRAVEVYGNRNVKSNFQRFVGTPSELRQLIQNYQAMRFITGARIDFEVWFEAWEKGFPEFTANRSDSNYPLSGEKQWKRIKNPETRPKYKEWTTPQQRADYGYRVVEVWQNRSIQSDSVLFTGTDLQLIQHCIQLEYEGGGNQQQSVSSDIVRYSGIPEITLYFSGIDKSIPGKDRIVEGEKSFRFMGYTDDPFVAQQRTDLELITEADINRIGTKIRAVFQGRPPYLWSKGKKQVIYHDWQRGYNLNVYASSHTEGERLVIAILSIFNHLIDERFLKYSEAKNPAKAYPSTTKIQVLNGEYKTPERLPNIDVNFKHGRIYLPTIKQTRVIA